MTAPVGDRLAQLGYDQARRMLLLAGLVVLGVVVLIMYVRRVDTVEVVATLLFVPIFLALMYRGVLGGLVAGIAASIVYALLRGPAIDAVGADEFAGLIASRSAAYILFGVFGGWSNQTLEASLDKLDLYDEIDDATGLNNARHFLVQTDLEVARARRYQTLFSVVELSFPLAALASLKARRRRTLLRDLGRQVRDAIRATDHVVHGRDGERHVFAAILPETAAEGAEVFRHRFEDRLREFLAGRGAVLTGPELRSTAMSYPGDEPGLDAARARFAEIDRLEHANHASGAPATTA
jgi:GGDEF domain-containing protein